MFQTLVTAIFNLKNTILQHTPQQSTMYAYLYLLVLLFLSAACDALVIASTSTAVLAFVLLSTTCAAAPAPAANSRCFWDGGRYTHCNLEDFLPKPESSQKVGKHAQAMLNR
jgi:hypothetical protein